jgi:hypothetical protein
MSQTALIIRSELIVAVPMLYIFPSLSFDLHTHIPTPTLYTFSHSYSRVSSTCFICFALLRLALLYYPFHFISFFSLLFAMLPFMLSLASSFTSPFYALFIGVLFPNCSTLNLPIRVLDRIPTDSTR